MWMACGQQCSSALRSTWITYIYSLYIPYPIQLSHLVYCKLVILIHYLNVYTHTCVCTGISSMDCKMHSIWNELNWIFKCSRYRRASTKTKTKSMLWHSFIYLKCICIIYWFNEPTICCWSSRWTWINSFIYTECFLIHISDVTSSCHIVDANRIFRLAVVHIHTTTDRIAPMATSKSIWKARKHKMPTINSIMNCAVPKFRMPLSAMDRA